MLQIMLSFGALYTFIPIIIIVILIAAAAGLSRGWDIFTLFGFEAITNMARGGGRGAGKGMRAGGYTAGSSAAITFRSRVPAPMKSPGKGAAGTLGAKLGQPIKRKYQNWRATRAEAQVAAGKKGRITGKPAQLYAPRQGTFRHRIGGKAPKELTIIKSPADVKAPAGLSKKSTALHQELGYLNPGAGKTSTSGEYLQKGGDKATRDYLRSHKEDYRQYRAEIRAAQNIKYGKTASYANMAIYAAMQKQMGNSPKLKGTLPPSPFGSNTPGRMARAKFVLKTLKNAGFKNVVKAEWGAEKQFYRKAYGKTAHTRGITYTKSRLTNWLPTQKKTIDNLMIKDPLNMLHAREEFLKDLRVKWNIAPDAKLEVLDLTHHQATKLIKYMKNYTATKKSRNQLIGALKP